MKKYTIAAVVILSVLTFKNSMAENVADSDVQGAQIKLMLRISDKMTKYAEKIGIDQKYISYCESKMYLETYQHPMNNHALFGVNYKNIKDSRQLGFIIGGRESFETSYITLCLANAKNALKQADIK